MCCANLMSPPKYDNHWRQWPWIHQLSALSSVLQTLEQLSDLQCFTGTCSVPVHTILNIKQALINYIRRNAAPVGQFKRIFCVIPCSHPFIIRHKPLIKSQWKGSLASYGTWSVCLSLLISYLFSVSIWQGWCEDTVHCCWGQWPHSLSLCVPQTNGMSLGHVIYQTVAVL